MLALVLTTALATGQAATGVPPLIVNAQVGKDDILVARIVTTVQVPIFREEKVNIGGREVTQRKVVYETKTQTSERRWPLRDATITTADGKKMELARLRTILAKPRPVVVSADGKAIGKALLEVLDPNTIVIVAKETMPAPTTPSIAPIPRK